MISVVTFDLWNTLFSKKSYSEIRLTSLYNFLEKQGIPISSNTVENAYHSKFHFHEVTFEDINFHHIYTKERITRVFKELELKIEEKEIEKLRLEFESLMIDNPPLLKKGVTDTLEELAADYQLGLISNTGVTPGPIISQVLENYGILQYFDVTIYSDETGLFKPHPKMFEIPLNELNCKATNAIHIGDMIETDVKGANEFDMLSIWLNDSNEINTTDIEPDYEISQISDAVPIIKSLS
ncbi:MAG: HAD family hydrolase [Promethearchaeota archaeon]|jgi:putative hydrolase of the HAD superfamily